MVFVEEVNLDRIRSEHGRVEESERRNEASAGTRLLRNKERPKLEVNNGGVFLNFDSIRESNYNSFYRGATCCNMSVQALQNELWIYTIIVLVGFHTPARKWQKEIRFRIAIV